MAFHHLEVIKTYCQWLLGQLSDAKEIDLQFSLEDLETIKVIGKGSGGVVQLVRHKWVGKLFALKVSHETPVICFLLSLIRSFCFHDFCIFLM